MAKKKRDAGLTEFDVYLQTDGALIALDASDTPDDQDAELVWNGEAKDSRDAIKRARKSNASLKKAPAADTAQEPDTADSVRKEKEVRTNERLGIKTRKTRKSVKKKTSTAKSKVRKGARKTAKKTTSRKRR